MYGVCLKELFQRFTSFYVICLFITLYVCLHFIGILQLFMSARCIKRCIQLHCYLEDYTFANKLYPGGSEGSESLQLIMVGAAHPGNTIPNHYMPLMTLAVEPIEGRCAAGAYCMLKGRDWEKFKCSRCLLDYHVVCVLCRSTDDKHDGCGCSEIVDGKERYD